MIRSRTRLPIARERTSAAPPLGGNRTTTARHALMPLLLLPLLLPLLRTTPVRKTKHEAGLGGACELPRYLMTVLQFLGLLSAVTSLLQVSAQVRPVRKTRYDAGPGGAGELPRYLMTVLQFLGLLSAVTLPSSVSAQARILEDRATLYITQKAARRAHGAVLRQRLVVTW